MIFINVQRLGYLRHIRQEDGSLDAFMILFNNIDTNNSNYIDREEFLALYCPSKKPLQHGDEKRLNFVSEAAFSLQSSTASYNECENSISSCDTTFPMLPKLAPQYNPDSIFRIGRNTIDKRDCSPYIYEQSISSLQSETSHIQVEEAICISTQTVQKDDK